MGPVFRNHIVICGWNARALKIVRALRKLSRRTIVIVYPDISGFVSATSKLNDVFLIAGDPKQKSVLLSADVGQAHSVLVLTDDSATEATDARSLQIALAVERIQVSVYTVVELRDLRNKDHFSWTKVDEVVVDEDITVKSVAQGIRHILESGDSASGIVYERQLLQLYSRLVDPHHRKSQLYRVDVPWAEVEALTFSEILEAGLRQGILPVAVAGYRYHEIEARAGESAWVSWKCDVQTNPPRGRPLKSLWPHWPENNWPLGILFLAAGECNLGQLRTKLCDRLKLDANPS